MTIYAPLAHRLSIAQLKWELEDLAFRYLAPDEYKKIASLLAENAANEKLIFSWLNPSLAKSLSVQVSKAKCQGVSSIFIQFGVR